MQPGTDSLRAVLDSVFAGPRYRWVESTDPLAFLGRWLAALRRWLVVLQDTHPALFNALPWILGALLAAIFAHAAWGFIRTVRAGGGAPGARTAAPADPRTPAWYRHEADRLAASGRFVEAMQLDFLGLVLELDRRRAVRFHPSKTPIEYATEAELPADRRQEFRELVGVLYSHAFARLPCGPAEFAEWRRRSVAERYATA
jgi:hypothetical protein